MLRCTLAGMIPLMASKKYSVLSDVFYEFRRGDFDYIMKSGSYYLLRELPAQIASKLLLPQVEAVLARQGGDGLWPGEDPVRLTYDILSAFAHIGVLDSLQEEGLLKDMTQTVADRTDYHALRIKMGFTGKVTVNDLFAVDGLARGIKESQTEDGSYEGTVFSTVYYTDKLLQLGVDESDPAVQRSVTYLFGQLNKIWDTGDKNGICAKYVFSTQDRVREYRAAWKHRPELQPSQASFSRLGILQSAYCIGLLIRLGRESDARVQAALDSILYMIQKYQSLCFAEMQNRDGADIKKFAFN